MHHQHNPADWTIHMFSLLWRGVFPHTHLHGVHAIVFALAHFLPALHHRLLPLRGLQCRRLLWLQVMAARSRLRELDTPRINRELSAAHSTDASSLIARYLGHMRTLKVRPSTIPWVRSR